MHMVLCMTYEAGGPDFTEAMERSPEEQLMFFVENNFPDMPTAIHKQGTSSVIHSGSFKVLK